MEQLESVLRQAVTSRALVAGGAGEFIPEKGQQRQAGEQSSSASVDLAAVKVKN